MTMGEGVPIRIVARVTDSERPAVIVAANRLTSALTKAGATDAVVKVSFDPAGGGPGLLVFSPVVEVSSSDPISAIDRDWSAMLDGYASAGFDSILLCTIFRHVADSGSAANVRERIRRLNLRMFQLSQSTGAALVDLDHALTLFGAAAIDGDYRLTSRLAAEVAGHALATAIFEEGLSPWVRADVEDRARLAHGGEPGMIGFMNEVRMKRKAGGAA